MTEQSEDIPVNVLSNEAKKQNRNCVMKTSRLCSNDAVLSV